MTLSSSRPDGDGGSSRWQRRTGFAVVLAILGAICLLSLAVGAQPMSPGRVIAALVTDPPTDDYAVVSGLRLPRTLLGIVAGMALGVAGALMQAVTRNPLADPGLLGVNAGAVFAVVLAVDLLGLRDMASYVWFALFGALAGTTAVFAISAAGGRDVDPVRLTLAGVAVGAALGGLSQVVMLLHPESFDEMRHWSAGSLSRPAAPVMPILLPLVMTGLMLALLVARHLNALALGEDVAAGLGVGTLRTRILAIVAISLLAGGATAAVGPIAFVGLMAPHVARRFAGADQRLVLALSLVIAPAVLLAADICGRLLLWPGELQAGIVTAFVGAPILILLANNRRMRRS